MILSAASSLYGAAAAWRRRWYANNPDKRRQLSQPVISVGNLSVGGSGKTPVVGAIARLLLERGERPVILSRGYRRRQAADGSTVVSDGERILVGVDRAGDEPLMLARAIPQIPVIVGIDRHLSGTLAERKFGATVHVLDDGFQHLVLSRDIDLLLVDESDLDEAVLPAGRLRERPDAAAAADAILIPDGTREATAQLQSALDVEIAFCVRRSLGSPVWMNGRTGAPPDRGERVFALAGIARPERFFEDLVSHGWTIAGTMSFRDHYRFGESDIGRVRLAAKAAGANVILTTEKDGTRLEGLLPDDLAVAVVPLLVDIEPSAFADWLLDRVRQARAARRGGAD